MREPGFFDGLFGGLGSMFAVGCMLLALLELVIKPLLSLL